MYGYIRDILGDKGDSVLTTTAAASVHEAVREMNRNGVGALLVLAESAIAGIFTERDVLRRIVDAQKESQTTTVGEVMTTEVRTIDVEAPVEEAMKVMTENRIRHLPVLDGGDLKGMISIGDVMRHVSLRLAAEVQHLQDYISGPGKPAAGAPPVE